nr:PREDICTED: facilitated trehalose transporter Tret1-like [Bemisia tabaci]
MSEKEKLHSTEKVYKPCEYSTENTGNFKSNLAQFYVTCVECIFLISLGMQYVMPTIVVGALHNKVGDSMALDDTTASWIGSILYFCQPLGSVTSGFLSERFGRKGAMMLVNVPFVAGWILLYYATSVQGLCIATLTMGLGIGFCEAPIAAYIGEVSQPHLRGIFTAMTTAACQLGNLIELFVGSVFDWRTSALISTVIPLISLISFTTIPESPVWLITKGKMEEAQKALGWLRGFLEPHHVQKEFDEMVRYARMSNTLSSEPGENFSEKIPLDSEKIPIKEVSDGFFKQRYRELTNPKLFLPLRMIFITFFFTQTASLAPFRAYFVRILDQFWFPIQSRWVLVMTGATAFIGSVTAIFILQKTGKRRVMLFSMAVNLLATFILAIYATFFTHTVDMTVSWILIVTFGISYFVGSLGINNIPWMMLCEVFPVRARGIASGLSAAWSYFVQFVMTKTFLQTESLIGLSGMFYMYALISVGACIYTYLCVPETEGKSLELIETYFTKNCDRKQKFRMLKRGRNPSKA